MNNTLQAYFQQQYQGQESFLQNVIFPIFGEENFDDGYSLPLLDHYPELCPLAKATGISSILHIGTIDVDFNPISIFDITVSSHVLLHRNRVGIQQIIRRIMTTYSSAFMLFHYEDAAQWDWRFTFCSKASNDELTDNKRYTFMLGPGQSCRTVAENFTKLLDKQGAVELADIQQAFDVEALSEEFFGKYKQHYEAFVQYITGKRFVKTGGKWLEKVEHEPHEQMYEAFGRNDKLVRDYVKKLLGRIVFLHFLQKKGWLGVPKGKRWGEGDQQFMRHLFTYATPEQQADFLDLVLEPLFDRGLDTDRAADRDLFDTHVPLPAGSVVKVPYLNGGLFERDALDEVTTRFPAEYFDALLQFLSQYNFTIDENDPNDAQVGVDPEMLGRIFENLLEDNKDKGAYYTPKEIVRYMCRQSLIAYLLTDLPADADPQAIRQFVSTYDVDTLGGRQSPLAAHIDERLRTVRICDPAIGSGAFPMGLLKELFLCRGAIEDFDNAAAIKRHIIQHNIYGVDIERGAVDIARLRFWLSLVVDEDKPHTLPNLDFKIMQGNSLLEQYQGVDLSRIAKDSLQLAAETQTLQLFDPILNDQRRKLRDLLSKYYNTTRHSDKHDLLSSINNCIHQQLNAYEPNLDLSDIDLQGNPHFFLWHTWFADVLSPTQGAGGFDILIGNPPYLRIQELRKLDSAFVDILARQFSSTTGSFDLYVLFVEKALELVKETGLICYIMPVKWTNSAFGKGLRTLLLNKSFISSIINFGAYQVFDASTYTGIQMFSKSDTLKYCELDKPLHDNRELNSYLNNLTDNDFANLKIENADAWILSKKSVYTVLDKLNRCPLRLGDVFEKIFQGIATSKDDVYFLYDCRSIDNDHIEGLSKYLDRKVVIERGLVKPLLKGKDVHRYQPISTSSFVIFPYSLSNGKAELYSENQIRELYPMGYTYLKECEPALRAREKGRFNNDTWYMFGRGQGLNYGNVPKLLAPEISCGGNYVLDVNGQYYSTTTIYGYIRKKQCLFSYESLLAILNSSICWWFLQNTGTVLANGYFRYKPTYLNPFPLPLITKETDAHLKALVCALLNETNYQTRLTLENSINEYVYQLYGLSREDINLIEK